MYIGPSLSGALAVWCNVPSPSLIAKFPTALNAAPLCVPLEDSLWTREGKRYTVKTPRIYTLPFWAKTRPTSEFRRVHHTGVMTWTKELQQRICEYFSVRLHSRLVYKAMLIKGALETTEIGLRTVCCQSWCMSSSAQSTIKVARSDNFTFLWVFIRTIEQRWFRYPVSGTWFFCCGWHKVGFMFFSSPSLPWVTEKKKKVVYR